jgi:hypothetical protein
LRRVVIGNDGIEARGGEEIVLERFGVLVAAALDGQRRGQILAPQGA